MVIYGNLIELIADNNDPDIKIEEINNIENVPWKFNADEPIPMEFFFIIFRRFWNDYN